MLLDQLVEVKINSHNIKYYKNENFNVNLNDIIRVDIKNLHRNTLKIKVNVMCDECGEKCEMNLLSHTICVKLKGCYICKKCVKNKIINTNLERYGVKFFNNIEKMKKTNLEKYGVENVSCSQIIKDKKKETSLKNWGVEYSFQNESIKNKFKNTCLEKYGVEHPLQNNDILEKSKRTCMLNNGVEYPMQSEDVIKKMINNNLEKYGVEFYTQTEKYKNSVKKNNILKHGKDWYMSSQDFKNKSKIKNLEKYGVEHNMQDENIYMKAQISAFKAKIHKNTGLFYRGEYEKDFLEYCYNKNIDVKKGIRFQYEFDNKKRFYFSDYFIESKNLIIEIKSKYYYYKYFDQNIEKMKSVINNRYNFIFIIDKNYKEFESLFYI